MKSECGKRSAIISSTFPYRLSSPLDCSPVCCGQTCRPLGGRLLSRSRRRRRRLKLCRCISICFPNPTWSSACLDSGLQESCEATASNHLSDSQLVLEVPWRLSPSTAIYFNGCIVTQHHEEDTPHTRFSSYSISNSLQLRPDHCSLDAKSLSFCALDNRSTAQQVFHMQRVAC